MEGLPLESGTRYKTTVSRTWICSRSGKTSTEYIRLLFCAENNVSSNKLVKIYRVRVVYIYETGIREGVMPTGIIGYRLYLTIPM